MEVHQCLLDPAPSCPSIKHYLLQLQAFAMSHTSPILQAAASLLGSNIASSGATSPSIMPICPCCVWAQVSAFRKLVDGKIGDKHEEVMSRMGAIMAAGILDAGIDRLPLQ